MPVRLGPFYLALSHALHSAFQLLKLVHCPFTRSYPRRFTFYVAHHFAPFFLLPFSFLYRPYRLAPEAVDANTAGTRDGVAYQSLYRADHQGGQRNLPEGLFVLLEIKRSAGMMAGSAISSLITSIKLLNSYFLICTSFMNPKS